MSPIGSLLSEKDGARVADSTGQRQQEAVDSVGMRVRGGVAAERKGPGQSGRAPLRGTGDPGLRPGGFLRPWGGGKTPWKTRGRWNPQGDPCALCARWYLSMKGDACEPRHARGVGSTPSRWKGLRREAPDRLCGGHGPASQRWGGRRLRAWGAGPFSEQERLLERRASAERRLRGTEEEGAVTREPAGRPRDNSRHPRGNRVHLALGAVIFKPVCAVEWTYVQAHGKSRGRSHGRHHAAPRLSAPVQRASVWDDALASAAGRSQRVRPPAERELRKGDSGAPARELFLPLENVKRPSGQRRPRAPRGWPSARARGVCPGPGREEGLPGALPGTRPPPPRAGRPARRRDSGPAPHPWKS